MSLYPDNPWDVVRLDGERLPGICEVDVVLPRGLGSIGSIDITLTCRTPDQLARLEEVMPRLMQKRSTLDEMSLDVYYPGLAPLGITRVVVYRVSLCGPGQEPGSQVVRFKCVEWLPAPAMPRTPP